MKNKKNKKNSSSKKNTQQTESYFMGMGGSYSYNSGKHKNKSAPISIDKKISFEKMIVGHYVESPPKDVNKNIYYVMQGNGIFEVRKNNIGTFYSHVCKFDDDSRILGLKSELEEGWELNVPKIPKVLLNQTASFFKEIYKKHQSEVFLQFFYDTEEGNYYLHCPRQIVSGASVSFENDDEFSVPRYIQVLEIHSHGSMGAFFSGTDDADEKADRFYGVIGRVNSSMEMKFRLNLGKRRFEINVEDIFEEEDEISFPKDWMDKVSTVKISKSKYKQKKNGFTCVDYRTFGGDYCYGDGSFSNNSSNKFFDSLNKFKKGVDDIYDDDNLIEEELELYESDELETVGKGRK